MSVLSDWGYSYVQTKLKVLRCFTGKSSKLKGLLNSGNAFKPSFPNHLPSYLFSVLSIYASSNDGVSNSKHRKPNYTMINKQHTGKYTERSGHGLT